ncbi:hypothetical protein WA026_015620 [Henosepilachna vigintioctopunctata]|uniref:Uncharacterized protein n=1 Tax=Henosepilachna vigintioctopunctata TaxID=420089 RepID=A0AAW1VFA5_9CUCU
MIYDCTWVGSFYLGESAESAEISAANDPSRRQSTRTRATDLLVVSDAAMEIAHARIQSYDTSVNIISVVQRDDDRLFTLPTRSPWPSLRTSKYGQGSGAHPHPRVIPNSET